MNSLDTNLLFYALNKDCPEHPVCAHLVAEALQTPEKWFIADQVWFDLILAHTLKAHGVLEFYTRNSQDFESYGFFRVTNPLTDPPN